MTAFDSRYSIPTAIRASLMEMAIHVSAPMEHGVRRAEAPPAYTKAGRRENDGGAMGNLRNVGNMHREDPPSSREAQRIGEDYFRPSQRCGAIALIRRGHPRYRR